MGRRCRVRNRESQVNEDLRECVVTLTQLRDQLEHVEEQLAQRHHIKFDIRRELVARIKRGALVEDELLAQWHDLYANYLAEIPVRPPWVTLGQRIQCHRYQPDDVAEIIRIEPDAKWAGGARIFLEWKFEGQIHMTWHSLEDIVTDWEPIQVSEVQNIAVYGGSFDPPHLGHIMVVSHLLLNDPSVDRILVVPCFEQRGKNLTQFSERLTLCEEAFGWLPRTQVSTIEQELGGESLTLRTMQKLKELNPAWNLRFVMGTDLLESCHTWEGWDELEKIAPPLPIGRAGISPVREGDPTPIAPLVSSSIVREALAKRDYKTAERYLPTRVLRTIRFHELYLSKED